MRQIYNGNTKLPNTFSKSISDGIPPAPYLPKLQDTGNAFSRYISIRLENDVKPPENLQSVILKKRARSKFVANALSLALVDTKSELNQSYWNTWHCNETLTQHGNKITARYCNNRWCNTCNRIRTAKLMNGYLPALKKLQ